MSADMLWAEMILGEKLGYHNLEQQCDRRQIILPLVEGIIRIEILGGMLWLDVDVEHWPSLNALLADF